MTGWRELILSEIERRWEPGEVFTRKDWLDHSMPAFRRQFPNNNALSESAQRALQDLRDEGAVEFLGHGTYRLPVRVSVDTAVADPPHDEDVRRGLLARTIYQVLATHGRPMRSREVLAEVAQSVTFNARELSTNPSGQLRWRTAANAAMSWSTFGGWLTRDENQQYTLTESGAEALGELSAEDLWLEITRRYHASKRDEDLQSTGWNAFLHWAHELTEVVDLDSEERDYKLKAAEKWAAAGRACLNDDPDWAERLKQACGAGNLVDSFAQTWLRNRIEDHPDEVREAVGQLFDSGSASAVEEFASRLNSWDIYVSPGDRTVFASCILLGADPASFAPYRPTLSKAWAERVGTQSGDTPGERYAALLTLCDRLLELWDGQGPELRDRLDAQGLGWAVLKWGAPVTWPPLKRAELEAWREGFSGDVQVDRGAGIRPNMESAAWEVLGAALRGETSVLAPGIRSWTVDNAQELIARFTTGDPTLGFADRLTQQLQGASDGALCLAAELLYIRDAPLHDMKASTKVDRLKAILGAMTSGPELPAPQVAGLADGGAFAGGQGYHSRGPEHLQWLCRFVLHWLDQPSDVTESALRDPFAFRDVTVGVPDDSRSIRYVVEYLAWPGVFPSVVSAAHRRNIRDGLIADIGSPTGDGDAQITQDLVALRALHDRKAKSYVDWYRPPYVNRWRPGSYAGPRAWLIRADDPGDVAGWVANGDVELRDEAGLVLERGQSLAAVQALVDDGYAHLAPSQRTELAVALHAFLDGIHEDDLVVTLAEERLVVGTVDEEAAATSSTSVLRRPVLWHARQTPLDAVPAKLSAALEQEGHVVDVTSVIDLLTELAGVDDSRRAPALSPAPKPPPQVLLPAVTDSLAKEMYMPVAPLQELVDLLNRRRQLVIYGPPGTGKTYVAKKLAERLAGAEDPSRVRLVQFHPSYAYEDFFEGFRPIEKDGQAHFSLQDGPLKLMAHEAAKPENSSKAYVLIIDEINRANLAKVFGELYFLLEYRQENVRLQYRPDQPFTLPDNLFLIGTMNTADRSIALVDAAIRRRFPFYEMHPQREPVKGVLMEYAKRKELTDDRVDLLAELNAAMGQRGHDLHIGPSYLMRDWLSEAGALELVWRYDILPLLHEHFYGSKTPEGVDQEFGIESLRKRIAARTNVASPAATDAEEMVDDAPDAV